MNTLSTHGDVSAPRPPSTPRPLVGLSLSMLLSARHGTPRDHVGRGHATWPIARPGWPALFLISVPLGALTYVLVRRFLPSDSPAAPPGPVKFDHSGTIVLALTLGAYAIAMTLGRRRFDPVNIALLLAAVAGIGLFVLVESNASSPLFRITMFRSLTISAGFVMRMFATTVAMGALVVGSFHLSSALRLAAGRVGLVMSSGPAVAALMGMPTGRAVDRFGAHPVVILGLVAMAIGATPRAAMPVSLGISGYIAPPAVITAGFAMFQAADNTAAMADSQADQRGVVSGQHNRSRNLGLVTGALAMGAAFTAATSRIDATAPQAVIAGMRLTFTVSAGLVTLALAIASAAYRARQPGTVLNFRQEDRGGQH